MRNYYIIEFLNLRSHKLFYYYMAQVIVDTATEFEDILELFQEFQVLLIHLIIILAIFP